MQVKAVSGAITGQQVDTLLIYLMEGSVGDIPGNATRETDQALKGAISELIEAGEITGKVGESAVLYPRGIIPAKRVVVVGLGPAESFTADIARRAVAQGMQKARSLKAQSVATPAFGTGRGHLDVSESARAVTEGALLGLYRFHGKKTSPQEESIPEALYIVAYDESEKSAVEQGIEVGRAFADGAMLARDLVNLPPNICTPVYLADTAVKIAEETGMKVEILEEKQMSSLKMGALLAVAQGSEAPPRFIILEHGAAHTGVPVIVLVGKGVTFDTGGYSLKTFEGMATMKADMAGGAAVLGAMLTVARLNLPLHVVGLVPAADNMVSGRAYRPQEILTASNGKTIEVISTDAEGRLLLADALVYAKRFNPDAVVDIATLTGACVVALGGAAAGLFSSSDTLRDRVITAGEYMAEKVWSMPLFPEYLKAIKSDVADIKNTGGRTGGVGTSAVFLQQFVDYPAWAHIDMAGMALDAADNPYVPGKGATGYGVRLMAETALRWAQSKGE